MLSREQNELLTCVGPATPGGEFQRRYWQPAALAEELPPNAAPIPVRLLGEDLVLFREPSTGSGQAGRPGLLGLHCSHRGADLSYGRLEDGGLRCIYHGWLYDIHGRCLEQPGEPPGSTFHEKIRHTAYPCVEMGSLILAYMGPGDPPLVPAYEFLMADEHQVFASKAFHDCNYLQGNEGNIDPAHHSFLHLRFGDGGDGRWQYYAEDTSPIIETEETDFGLRVYAIREIGDGRSYIKVTNFILPNLAAITGDTDGYGINWHVPIDDTHHWKYNITFRRSGLDRETRRSGRSGSGPDYYLTRNKGNRYLQDREEMRTHTFAGLGTTDFVAQDALATEGPGPIQDRTQEHLGYTDKAIAAARRVLLRAVHDVMEGADPQHVVRDPARNHFPDLGARKDIVPASIPWRRYWEHEEAPRVVALTS